MHLDVTQLIIHSIGIIKRCQTKYTYAHTNLMLQPVLVYIYWQPNNWYNFELYRQHASEIEEFKRRIKDFLVFIPVPVRSFGEWMNTAESLRARSAN
jgi:hypothetical protein